MVNPDRNLYEPPYDDALLYDGDLEPERPRSRPLVVLLGTVVLAAFAGVVWVAYNQGVKQGQGVPLLQADAGPTRIVPDPATSSTLNPAPDKSYERLWGEAPEGEAQVQVMPQPEQPRTIPAPQDVASTSLGGPLEQKATDVTPPDPRMDSTTGSVSSVPNSAPRTITNTPPALFGPKPQTEDITSELPPVESVSPPVSAPRSVAPPSLPSLTSPVATNPVAPKPIAPKPVVVAQAPTPKAVAPTPTVPTPSLSVKEPKAIEPVAPPSSEDGLSAVEPSPEPPVKAPSAAKSGSYMIQLGSFPEDALAASAWSKIKSKNQGLLGGFSPSIQPKEIEGKGTWYRLRVGGFADKASAADVCQQLTASGQACIVAGK
ncbi:MAG: SPOR domain-containing protein [Micropepsaceae bacterium]